jgi:hypothetical protein
MTVKTKAAALASVVVESSSLSYRYLHYHMITPNRVTSRLRWTMTSGGMYDVSKVHHDPWVTMRLMTSGGMYDVSKVHIYMTQGSTHDIRWNVRCFKSSYLHDAWVAMRLMTSGGMYDVSKVHIYMTHGSQ